jgi:hypothetical protein
MRAIAKEPPRNQLAKICHKIINFLSICLLGLLTLLLRKVKYTVHVYHIYICIYIYMYLYVCVNGTI